MYQIILTYVHVHNVCNLAIIETRTTYLCLPFSQSLALFFVGTIGSSMLCYATPYTPETMPMKIGAFTLFTSVMGATMAPLVMMAGEWMYCCLQTYVIITSLCCIHLAHTLWQEHLAKVIVGGLVFTYTTFDRLSLV